MKQIYSFQQIKLLDKLILTEKMKRTLKKRKD